MKTLAVMAAALLLPVGALAADPARETSRAAPGAQASAAAKDARAEKSCESSTASRIRRSKDDCGRDAQPVTRYSREDLESTGQFDMADALRRLDPRFH